MATAVEVYGGIFFRLFEAKPGTNFCDVCKSHLNQTIEYKQLKKITQSAALQNKILSN